MMKHFGGHNMIQIWRWVVDGLLYQERWSYKVNVCEICRNVMMYIINVNTSSLFL